VKLAILACLGYVVYSHWNRPTFNHYSNQQNGFLSIGKLQEDHALCSKLRSVPQDPSGHRERNTRWNDDQKPILIRNATVWTGEPVAETSPEDAHTGKGYQWISADVFMEYGLIKRVEPGIPVTELPDDCAIYDAKGRQLTSGIVDMHSHSTVDSLPELRGNDDTNELSNDITPYVRSLDGINPLDHQLQVIKSGGVTTSLILPGSGNNMGGEAYVIKHAVGKADGRREISAEDMLADPDKTWRYMKMACGENPKAVYGRVGRDLGPASRLGEAWYFRHAFEQASALVREQDDWCAAADSIGAENMVTYLPQDLQWESLGALLRGQVLLNTHCYTVPDLEAFIRHTNEFKFRIRAFHHAHQTYLVPDILKRAWGGRPPAAALFADNMYYKAEAYVASEQAGKILYDNGITPVYVSDNPVINAQHVVFEAAKAYRNGLNYHAALAGVTSASAELLGLGERIGKVLPGFDADVVVWDSDPLSVGAAPVQVWIDGTPQFEDPVELKKPVSPHSLPIERLEPMEMAAEEVKDVVLEGITKIMLPGLEQLLSVETDSLVVVQQGRIVCIGRCADETIVAKTDGARIVALSNGYVAPALTAFASTLGLAEIEAEGSTQDGYNNDVTFSRAVDGLALDTKNLREAYLKGVTKAISAPTFIYGGSKGVSVGFRTGAMHAQKQHAVWQDEVALHYTLTKTNMAPSLSAAIGLLKSKLLKAVTANNTELVGEARYLEKVVQGMMPLVVTVHSADLIASLLRVKADVEAAISAEDSSSTAQLRLILVGGAESHLLADELAAANISVVLAPLLPYSETWDQRRSLTGAPMTNGTTIDVLHAAGVQVAIGTEEDWETRDLYLSAGIAYANGGGKFSERDALAFVSSNIYDMLGIKDKKSDGTNEFVVFEGNPLEINGRIRAVADGNGSISLWS
jgi:imidazolonepropionase-like amidohydrolase